MCIWGEGGGGGGRAQFARPAIQTSVKFREYVEERLRSLLTYHFKLGKFTNFKALFPVAKE